MIMLGHLLWGDRAKGDVRVWERVYFSMLRQGLPLITNWGNRFHSKQSEIFTKKKKVTFSKMR